MVRKKKQSNKSRSAKKKKVSNKERILAIIYLFFIFGFFISTLFVMFGYFSLEGMVLALFLAFIFGLIMWKKRRDMVS